MAKGKHPSNAAADVSPELEAMNAEHRRLASLVMEQGVRWRIHRFVCSLLTRMLPPLRRSCQKQGTSLARPYPSRIVRCLFALFVLAHQITVTSPHHTTPTNK